MKLIFISIIFLLLNFGSDTNNKQQLLCHKWRQIGVKNYGKSYKAIDKSMSELISFKLDGTFEKELYGRLHFKGRWLFSNDSSKLAIGIYEMNGKILIGNEIPFHNKFANDSIIKLTKDTLIDGQLKYYGAEKRYGHDDVYYLREE